MKKKKKYSVGSLFAGVGGICQAFTNASCKVVWANEIDKNACITYKLNYKTTKLIQDDIRNLDKNNLESIDILTAGFPCQPFSVAGKSRGFEDERGKLFFEFIRILNDLKPEVYLLENVKNIVTHHNGESFKTIKDEIYKTGYSFIPFILNASKYTQIPQGRERLYIVGFKNEKEYSFEKPIKVNINEIVSKYSSKFIIPSISITKPEPFTSFLDDLTVNETDFYNNESNMIHKKVMEAVCREDTVYQFRRHYVRENKSGVCPTLTANMGSGGHNVPIILRNGVPRRLTPKECFNLQGFDKNFQLPENVPKGQLYKQVGNSVVVSMVQRIAEEIIRVLYEN